LRRALGPRLCSSFGPGQVGVLRTTGRAFGGGQAAQVPVRQGPVVMVTSKLVQAAHRRRLHVHVWTIDDPAEMERLLDLGVDGIMTDRPAELKRVLEARGEWT